MGNFAGGGFSASLQNSHRQKPSQSDLARDYAEKMLELMGFDYAVETTETENEILIQLTGVNAGDIIGRRGRRAWTRFSIC